MAAIDPAQLQQITEQMTGAMIAALQPIVEQLDAATPEQVRPVVGRREPVLFAALSSFLRWPDRRQALGYFEGFNIVGTCPKVGCSRRSSCGSFLKGVSSAPGPGN